MKYYELNKEEKTLLKDFEKGKLNSVRNLTKQRKLYKDLARATLNKNKNINIRISEKDLLKLKSKAVVLGIPYQTLAASILHRSNTE